jgi:hypothetical protein
MNPDLKDVYKHMLSLGLGALAHANRHSNFSSELNEHWDSLSVLQAAHAAEILIKARIAQEHPLLIFEKMPRPLQGVSEPLELKQLFEQGKTLQYSDLPDCLWAATGIHLPNVELYRNFGKLRNSIQHFAPASDRDVSFETRQFIFSVIDPFINSCWELYAIDYIEDYDPYDYIIPDLLDSEIYFLVSPGAAVIDVDDFNWLDENPEYKAEMTRRFCEAKLKASEMERN